MITASPRLNHISSHCTAVLIHMVVKLLVPFKASKVYSLCTFDTTFIDDKSMDVLSLVHVGRQCPFSAKRRIV